jgi:hypothetical protein
MGSLMKAFAVKIMIRATPERIWQLLTDAPGYTSWSNTIDKVDGKIAPGERVTVHPKINPGRSFPVKVTKFGVPQGRAWTGGMPLGTLPGRAQVHIDAAPKWRRGISDARGIHWIAVAADRPLHSGSAAGIR